MDQIPIQMGEKLKGWALFRRGVIEGIVTVLVIFTFLAITSCARTVYVPVETKTVETEYRDILHRDSIYVRDSVYVREKGDTVFEYRYRYIYRDVLRVDSFIRTDSVYVDKPYPVAAALTKWQRIKMDVGGCAMGVFSAIIAAGVGWFVFRLLR